MGRRSSEGMTSAFCKGASRIQAGAFSTNENLCSTASFASNRFRCLSVLVVGRVVQRHPTLPDLAAETCENCIASWLQWSCMARQFAPQITCCGEAFFHPPPFPPSGGG